MDHPRKKAGDRTCKLQVKTGTCVSSRCLLYLNTILCEDSEAVLFYLYDLVPGASLADTTITTAHVVDVVVEQLVTSNNC